MSGRAIDHIVLAGRGLARLAAAYEGLGFTLTPRAEHEPRMGTANRLAQFSERNFLELLEVDRPGEIMPHDLNAPLPVFSFGAHARAALERREGIAFLVFAGDDARADLAGFAAAGLAPYAPFDFSRKASLPDGGETIVSFSLGFAVSPHAPDAPVFICQNHAQARFWKPEFQSHPNGAAGIRAVWLATPEPEREAAFFSALYGGAILTAGGGFDVVCGPRQFLRLRTPEAVAALDRGFDVADAAPRYVGVEIAGATRDLISSDAAGGMFIRWTGI